MKRATMHFDQTRTADDSEARILPLINVVFLLLIFFMIAGSLSVTEPFDVDVPQSSSEGRHEADSLIILFGRDGQLALDGSILSESLLLQQLEQRLAADKALRIQLNADAQLNGNRVVLLMEKLRKAGVLRLRLVTLQATP